MDSPARMLIRSAWLARAGARVVVMLLFAWAGIVVGGCGSGAVGQQGITHVGAGSVEQSTRAGARGVDRPDVASTRSAVERVIERLTPAEQVGQLVMTKLEGQRLGAEDRRSIEGHHLGGVILFAYNYRDARQLRAFNAEVQRAGRSGNGPGIGMLVSVDQEGGPVRRFADQPPARSQVQLGRAGSSRAARRSASATGVALARLGINLNLAPVADLAEGPKRVMAYRSFGGDPQRVGAFVTATVVGLQERGVSAGAKHFPGFGAATANSDDGVATVRRSRAQLEEVDLVPFQAAVDAGIDVIMVSHGIYPGLGATRPATIAPQVIEPILREQLGFEGVAITDSMNAKGLRGAWSGTVPQACAAAVRRGIDIVLLTGSMETARLCHMRILDAVKSGEIPQARLRDAVTRVLELKQRRGLL